MCLSISAGQSPQELEAFEERIGFRFRERALLVQSLTHRSFVNECPDFQGADNQRLEFLGDAIVDFIVGEWLYWRYPDAREGELTSLRAHVVYTEGLASLAEELGLGTLLQLGKGEATSGGHERPANLCAAFEALVGAMYLDRGLAATQQWLNELLERHADDINRYRQHKDAKSRLQEVVQGRLHLTPLYRIVREEGPDHAKQFTAQVAVNEQVLGEGTGASKQLAEQAAAANALEALSQP